MVRRKVLAQRTVRWLPKGRAEDKSEGSTSSRRRTRGAYANDAASANSRKSASRSTWDEDEDEDDNENEEDDNENENESEASQDESNQEDSDDKPLPQSTWTSQNVSDDEQKETDEAESSAKENGEENENEGEEEDNEDELLSSPPGTPPPKQRKRATKAQSTSPSKTPKRPLKIRLKIPRAGQSTTTPTPSDEMPLKPGRKGHPKHADIESESDEDEDESSRSASVTAPARLTQRQAALAGMVEAPGHVVLEETVSKKKKLLNEAELALKREETARKRKHLSVKKLEDEKTETINRLLKKQSRRGKKVVADDEDAEQDAEDVAVPALVPVIPTSFRWISTTKLDSSFLSFSVPQNILETVDVQAAAVPPAPKQPPLCDVEGCSQPRKYKLVSNPMRGGCGLEHLKALEAAA